MTVSAALTNKDKIKYLKRYILLDKEINRKLEEVSYWRDRLNKITAIYAAVPQDGGGSIRPRQEAVIAKIVDLEAEIDREIDELVKIRDDIKNTIEAVEDDRERLLLQYRYIDGKTLGWIACEMHYNYRWTKRLHGRAISKLKLAPTSPY